LWGTDGSNEKWDWNKSKIAHGKLLKRDRNVKKIAYTEKCFTQLNRIILCNGKIGK
jgi:hypothetical protein